MLQQLISVISKLPGQGIDPQCCTNVVNAITVAATAIAAAVNNTTQNQPPPATVDLTEVVNALNNVFTTLKLYPGIWSKCCDEMHADLELIAKAIPGGIELKPVVDAIDRSAAMLDVPQAILDQLFNDKAIPAQYKPLVQGAPWSWVHTVLAEAASVSPIIGYLEHVFGDDADFEAGVRLARERFKAISGKALGSLKDVNKAAGPDTTGALAAGMKALLHDHDTLLEPTIKALVEAVASELTPAPGTVPTLGNIGVSPDGPISAATGIAVTATFATWLASFAGIHENESLKHFAELFASAVGYEEMRDVLIGPLVRHGIAAVADLQAKARFQQSLPGHAAVASWLARQLISEGDARRLAAYDGLNSTLMGIETTAAQSALNPRMLLQLIQTGLFTDDDLQDEMTFNGVRPRSQHRLVMAAPYLATRSERDQLRSTLELAYANGLLADRELVDQVNAIEHNTDRGDLILRNAKWKKTIAITKDLETEYSTLFKGGLLDDAGFKNHLEGLGLQPDMVDAIAAKSEAQAEAALQRQTIRTAAALARTTAGEERRAAVKNYQAGILDAAGLHAALVATGLTVLQASAWVALAVATKSGNQRWIYGLQLTPDEAALLRSRVAALTAQRKRNQITDQQYVEQLRALNIPDRYVNALRANADALVTPKSSAFAVPLQTS